MVEQSKEVTRLLQDARNGDPQAINELLPMVYDQLREIARSMFRRSPVNQENTVQPTMLVHDVFLKLVEKKDIDWENRAHFFAVAAKAIRNLLVDHARKQNARKRGGNWNKIPLAIANNHLANSEIDVVELESVLEELGKVSPRQEQIVEMRFFSGLKVEEVAEVLGISQRTVMYDWRMAKAWLKSKLEQD